MNPGARLHRINYYKVRDDFVTWLNARELSEGYRRQLISHLDRFVARIEGPMDVVRAFESLSRGQKKNLSRALRNLFNFLESQGFEKAYLEVLRANIPKVQTGIDLRVPTELEIVESLQKMDEAYAKYNAIYNLVLDSGLRLTEAVRFKNNFLRTDIERLDDFCVATLGYFRESKIAYCAFFTTATMELLTGQPEVSYGNTKTYLNDRSVISWKYLRKFAFDKMIELEIPESVADFIQGRVPKKVGAKHYMVLVRQAKKFYPRYAEYITQLRQKALN